MVMALLAMFGYLYTEQDTARRHAAGIFGGSLGAALLLWGMEEIKRGRIRGKRVQVQRSDAPVVFLLLLLGKRVAPALLMIGAAIWIVFSRTT